MGYILESLPSPNFTSGNEAKAVYGRARTIEAIAIHWWGDPNLNLTYEGTVAWMRNKASGVSAHYIATGTGRRVASLVAEEHISWATNKANPYTISIECDPRCRNEDYDVVAELIASIWKRRGIMPLVPHRQFVATACPGNWDLGRLNELARKKLEGDDMSKVDIGIARVLAYHIGGRNGLDGTPNALNGDVDVELSKNHVNQETNKDAWMWYESAEAKNWREKRLPALVKKAQSADEYKAKYEEALKLVEDLKKQRTEDSELLDALDERLDRNDK
jgi:hypothetical protein